MPEETKESKAQKLAAARKKLKEFQNRAGSDNTAATTSIVDVASSTPPPPSTGSISSNISERSDSELNLVTHTNTSGNEPTAAPPPPLATAANYFADVASPPAPVVAAATAFDTPAGDSQQQHVNAIQMLITEKQQITAELYKSQTAGREKELELEELRLQYSNTTQRLEDIQQRYLTQQASVEKVRNHNAELQHKLAQASAQTDDHTAHVDELKRQLGVVQARNAELEQQSRDRGNELEMAQLRIRQLSDDSANSKDDRVEALTQTQFMYEQQIRDLQAMVQQLSEDKEQSNTQYQNYVQHLKAEVSALNEKNSELLDESGKLQERERQLVEHVGGLEREIQRNISRQDQLREAQQQRQDSNDAATAPQANGKLQERIAELEFERHEFLLKIKSQEDYLQRHTDEQHQRQHELAELRERLERVTAEQPDTAKLLATMESDKVAASRALTQNVEMKRQLDELEQRFVQLTNDKAELMNQLDAEEYANREMRSNYAALEERLHSGDERYRFKDEEMIRLSHENVELAQQNEALQKILHSMQRRTVSKEHSDSEHHHERDHEDVHNHDHEHVHNHSDAEPEACQEANETHDHNSSCREPLDDAHQQSSHPRHTENSSVTHNMPTSEAVEKLQARFTQLMSQVADLTEEKQRLEHLVLQLQGETETIGEYITLYQTQRRMLKQREYEKAAQMQLLQAEREQMRDKLAILNSLVGSLPQTQHNGATFTAATENGDRTAADVATTEIEQRTEATELHQTAPQQRQQQGELLSDELALHDQLNSTETQAILGKIQNILSEIKEDTKHLPTVPSVDHLNCCQGKFEVV